MSSNKDHPIRDRIKFAADIIVALVAGIALWNNFTANSLSRQAINVANDSLKIAMHANQISDDEFMLRNRPYIKIDAEYNAELDMPDFTHIKGFKLYAQNYGSIPAINSVFILSAQYSGKWRELDRRTSFVVMPGDRKEIMDFGNALLLSNNPGGRVDRIKLDCIYRAGSKTHHTMRQYSFRFMEPLGTLGTVTQQEEEAD